MKRFISVNLSTSEIDILNMDEFPSIFKDGDRVVVNNALPLHGRFRAISPQNSKTFDIGIRKHLKDDLYLVSMPSRMKIESRIYLGEFFETIGDVIDMVSSTERIVRFFGDIDELNKGNVFVPKYLEFDKNVNLCNHYGSEPMMDGAPTAGLNIDRATWIKLELNEAKIVEMTAEVSRMNYLDVDRVNMNKVAAPTEEFLITHDAADEINSGSRICCVGISTVKGMVKSLDPEGKIRPMVGSSNRLMDKIDYPFDMYFGNLEIGNTTGKIFQKSFGPKIIEAYEMAKYHAMDFGITGDSILIIK